MKNFQLHRRETHQQALRFLRTELDTALTLAEVARTAKGKDKRQRNVSNARRSYDELIRFRPQTSLTKEEEKEIDTGMAKLKTVLLALGEEL